MFLQPIALDDVATAIAHIATGPAVNGIVEIAGPGPFRLDELVRRVLKEGNDSRRMITDTRARYFGVTVSQRTLLPSADAVVGEIRIQERFAQLAAAEHQHRRARDAHRLASPWRLSDTRSRAGTSSGPFRRE